MRTRLMLPMTMMAALALLLAACSPAVAPTPSPPATPEPPLFGGPTGYNGQTGNGGVLTEPVDPPMVTGLPDVASVVERVAPAVVLVTATIQTTNAFQRVVERTSQGSGVIVDEGGYILTNNHVVENAVSVRVTLPDRTRHNAEVVGTDPASDLAVLRIDPDNVRNMVVVPLGDTEAMRIGDWVIAIGNPLGLQGSVTVGVISAKHRQLTIPETGRTLYDLVQTDAVINPGNSGGPLLNLRGEVIGINTAIIRGQLSSGQAAEGIGFAVSMSTAIPVARQLIETGAVQRARLGVEIDRREVTPALAEELGLPVDHGALIAGVVPGSGASAAGIRAEDIIVAIDGQTIITFTDLQRLLLSAYRPGDQVQVTVIRGETERSFDVTLGS